MLNRLLSYLCVIVIAATLISCDNAINYKKVHEDFSDVKSTADKSHIDSILNQLPKYAEICKNVRYNKLRYDASLLFDFRTIELYQNSKEIAEVMGVLVADLGYARFFERVQTCTDLLDAAKTTAEKLAVGNDIFMTFVPKIEENLNNEQIIFEMVDSLLNADAIVPTESEKYGISAMFICGFWLETTHLALAQQPVIDDANMESVENHFKVLHQINVLLDQLSDTEIIEGLKKDFKTIEEVGPHSEKIADVIENVRNKLLKSV